MTTNTDVMTGMTTWVCPGCGDRQEALASQMTHRCPGRKSQMTAYAVVESPSPIALSTQDQGDEALAARLLAGRPRKRAPGKNAQRITCGCRAIRVFPAILAKGPITCGVCGSDFS